MRKLISPKGWSLISLATVVFLSLGAAYSRDLPPPQLQEQNPAPSDGQSNSGNSASRYGDSRDPLRIVSFVIKTPSPIQVAFGRSVILDFVMIVQVGPNSGIAADDALSKLSVVVDGQTPRNVPATIRLTAPNEVAGSVAFLADVPLFSDPLWQSEHLAYLVNDITGTRSSFVNIVVESSPLSRGIYAAAGFGGLFFLTYVFVFALWRARAERATAPSPSGMVPSPQQDNAELPPPPEPVPLPAVPTALLGALSAQRALLVIGGRASARSGFPSEQALVEMLIPRLRNELSEPLRNILDKATASRASRQLVKADYSQIMDAIASAVPRDRLAAEIKDIFSRVSPSSQFCDMLAKMPWHGVISLAWDSYAESVFMRSGRSSSSDWRKFTLDESADLPSAARSGGRLFLRPFGDIERVPSLSLSMEEFRRNLLRWPEFQRQVGLLLQTQTFVFVGVDIEMVEQFLQSVSSDLDVSGPRHFALVPSRIENELLQSTLSRFGLQILPYQEGSNDQGMVDFISQLSRHLRDSVPAPVTAKGTGADHFASDRIEGVKLTNIGLFDSLELKFQVEPVDELKSAPWTVIFGPNGCGKSSILRAIGLVLAGNEAIDVAPRLLQSGKAEGQIEIQFGSNTFKVRLVRDREKVLLQTGPATPVQGGLALVLGFPALRGGPSPNPRGVASQLQPRGSEPADLLPMIYGDIDKRLGNFKQWLINVLEQAGRKVPRAIGMKTLLDDIIRDVVPGEFQRFAPLDSTYVIKVKTDDSDTPSPKDVAFDDLSQGMTSIFNWLGVLAQRIYDFYPDAQKPEKNHAIVMIDEIDAHLHPDWQRRLVELTKKFFPNVQVLATSHSPLLAGALRRQEICVLERDPFTKVVAPLPVSIDPYGMRAQYILMSRIFGLTSDRNPELEQRISRHVELFQKRERSPEEETELEKLTEELQDFRYAGVRPARSAPAAPTAELADALRERFGTSPPSSEAPASISGAAP